MTTSAYTASVSKIAPRTRTLADLAPGGITSLFKNYTRADTKRVLKQKTVQSASTVLGIGLAQNVGKFTSPLLNLWGQSVGTGLIRMASQQQSTTPTLRHWPYRADCPQRYNMNYHKYRARGGQIGLEEAVKGYVYGDLNTGDMARFYFFCLAFDQIVKEGITGDLAELGVYKGNTASLIADFARRLGTTAYLLDTYEGFNELDLTGIDANAKPKSFNDTSLEAVKELVGEDRTRFIKGFFPDTSGELPDDNRYCLVHIDCDLYAPMTSALEYFYPRMVPGGFLVVHDYSSLCWSGAERAADEFFSDKPECLIPLPDGAGSVAIRKTRPVDHGENWLDRKRRSILQLDWTEAGNGKLLELLTSGWSGAEPWGVWGIADRHTLSLVPPEGHNRELGLEFDVKAALTALRPNQVIDVIVGERKLATWTFSIEGNRGIRHLIIPPEVMASAESNSTPINIDFKPRSVITVSEISPGSGDRRSLGLGLHRLRLRS